MSLTVITNNKPRNLLTWHDLPKKAQVDLDYLSEDDRHSDRIVMYKGEFYDVHEFMRVTGDELKTWDGYMSHSYFSGLVVRYVDDFERVITGRYYQ